MDGVSDDGICALCAPVWDATIEMPGPNWHYECGLRSVVGGIGHLTNHQFWCSEMNDPDGGHTYRASALLVAKWVRLRSIEEATAVEGGRDDRLDE